MSIDKEKLSEMEDYIKKGKDIFIKIIGEKSFAFKDFVDELEKSQTDFYELDNKALATKSGQKIADKFHIIWAVSIIITCSSFFKECKKYGTLFPITAKLIEFLYEDYDKEKAYSLYEPLNYKKYLMMKETNNTVKDEVKPEPESEKPFNGNYIDLE